MRSFLLSLTVLFCVSLSAQSSADSVKAAVNKLFTSMLNADSAMLKSSFTEFAILQTIENSKEGKLNVRTEPVQDFVSFIGTQKKDACDERITFETVKIDGPLAIAWTPYKFFYNGKFSHCGVNSFQLLRVDGVWKIQYLIDTRKKDNCL